LNRITIAIVDSGLSIDPPSSAREPGGINLSGEGDENDTSDPRNHGTAIGLSIRTIAPNVRLIPIKVLDRHGNMRDRQCVDRAFEWIVERWADLPIDIVCAAFADRGHYVSDDPFRDTPLQRSIAALRANGIATVVPAGNRYPERPIWKPAGMPWPAILREVISVGELTNGPDGFRLSRTTQRLHQSQGTGCWTTIFAPPLAPGESSGSCATVAGSLARIRERNSGATVDALAEQLRHPWNCARDGSALSWPMLGSV
jgi:subtilisin family serine protease